MKTFSVRMNKLVIVDEGGNEGGDESGDDSGDEEGVVMK